MAIGPRLAACRESDPWAFRLAVALLVVLTAWPLWYAIRYRYGVVPFGGTDFKAYYVTGLRVRHGLPLYGNDLTQVVSKPRATRFLYPPVVALPFVALTVTSPGVARIVFLTIQFGFLWGSILALLAAWGVPLTRWRAVAVGWLLAGVQPVFFLLRIGNVTGFLAGLLCLSAAVTVSPRGPSRPVLGGVFAALAGIP